MFERGISELDVRQVLEDHVVVEEYPDESPFPGRLLLGRVGGRPIHVVACFDRPGHTIVIITVYEPTPDRWTSGFTKRRTT